ncbi:MAG: WGR domain-containing protein [Sandaracinaceae bacterium]|nr:WGR domain-containing protein [Sandaracinaceae bacterium]
MAKVKAWKDGAPGAPSYPDDFEIVKKAVLQFTDLKANNNKYYGIELHKAGAHDYRVYTHYGRTDDLETNPNAGARESRYYPGDPAGAQACYDQIYREKTAPSKGYKELSLASSKIGSHKARGTSSGHVDDKTLEKIAGKADAPKPKVQPSTLPPGVQSLISYIYDEATNALTSTVAAKITANGIETPLGVLTIGQIEKGEAILTTAYQLFQQEKKPKSYADELSRLSGEFYTLIPHRIGRTRAAIQEAVIDTLAEFEQKQETLQLMKDMLKVNGEGDNILFDSQIDQKYKALGCEVGWVEPGSGNFKELEDYVLRSQVKHKNVKVKNIYTLQRKAEREVYDASVGNERLLFHGSRIKNWVGILSRGILLPKIVVSLGVNRTDAGWLGNGIYFGDAACTSSFYTSPGRKGTRLMSLARVGLGKMKEFTKITYGIQEPPAGFHSCHGVRRKAGVNSQFDDDEYVVYRTQQQKLEYLVEFTS